MHTIHFFLVRCRCSTLVLMTSSSFTPSSRRYLLQGSISTSCFCCFRGAALLGWCDRIWILLSRSMLLTSRGKKGVEAVCGFTIPSCLCRLLLFISFYFFCLPAATTYIIEQGLNKVLHIQFQCCNRSDMMASGCWEAETNFPCCPALKKKLAAEDGKRWAKGSIKGSPSEPLKTFLLNWINLVYGYRSLRCFPWQVPRCHGENYY